MESLPKVCMGTISGADPSVRKFGALIEGKLKIGHVIKSNGLVGKNLLGVGAVGLGIQLPRVLVDGNAITRMLGLRTQEFFGSGLHVGVKHGV